MSSRSTRNPHHTHYLARQLDGKTGPTCSVKDVAQIAACIGREFQPELLALISPPDPLLLQQSLEQLLASELVYTRGQAPNLRYVFKHALIQEAAYDSLLKARRVQVHAQIAVALEQHFPQTKVAEPELLAYHYNAAGLTNEAIDYWLKAGELGLQRVALNEAIAHLDKGVEALGTLPVSVTRDARELALRTLLGTAWMMLRGRAAPEVEANFGPALKLAKALNHQPNYLAVVHGLYAYDVVRDASQVLQVGEGNAGNGRSARRSGAENRRTAGDNFEPVERSPSGGPSSRRQRRRPLRRGPGPTHRDSRITIPLHCEGWGTACCAARLPRAGIAATRGGRLARPRRAPFGSASC